MNKSGLFRILNMALLFSFILQAITSVILFLRIKINYTHLIFEIHQYNGLFMIVAAAIHITLNRGWIRANFFKKR